MVERFGPAGAVDGRPGQRRPHVMQLPEDRAGGVRPVRPPVQDAGLDGAHLVPLHQVVPCIEVRRHRRMRLQAAPQLVHAAGGLLVVGDAGRGRCHRLVGDRLAQGPPGRRRLPAELGDEPWPGVAIVPVIPPVPHVPRVVCLVCRVVRREGVGPGPGTARGVGPRRVDAAQDLREIGGVVALAPRQITARPGRPLLRLAQPLVLVVAVPDDQRRVRGEPGDVLLGLGEDLATQRFVLRVGRAGEREVLPHQQSQLVAQLVEVVGLVDAAAPDAHQVAADIDDASQHILQPLAGHPSGQHVQWDPVDALDQYRLVVDDDGEPRSCVIGGPVQGGGAEADPAPLGVQQATVRIAQQHPGRGQRGIPVPDRMPAAGAGNLPGEGDRAPTGGQSPCHDGGLVDHDLDGQRIAVAGVAALDADVHPQCAGPAAYAGHDPHLGQPGPAPRLQERGPPDPGPGQRRPPVPAEATGHLADEVERFGVGVRARADPGPQRLRLGVGRAQVHGEPPLGAVVVRRRPDGVPVAAVHVPAAAQRPPVQRDARDRVQAGEHHVDPLAVDGGDRREGPLVDPVGAADPGDGVLVAVDHRVRDEPGAQQIVMHRTGHPPRDRVSEERPRLLRQRRGSVLVHPQRPAVVERQAAPCEIGRGGRGSVLRHSRPPCRRRRSS